MKNIKLLSVLFLFTVVVLATSGCFIGPDRGYHGHFEGGPGWRR